MFVDLQTEISMTAQYVDLENSSVLITGGASGIGADFVRAFAKQGAKVAFIDIETKAAEKLIEEISSLGLNAPVYRYCDLSNLEQIKSVVDQLVVESGSFKVLVNNAASDNRHRPEEVTPQYWKNSLDLNLGQQFFCAQAVYESMKLQGKGSIINLGSVCYHMKLPNLTAYATSKAAIVGLTRSLAREWGGENIRVNTLVPGCVMTPKQLEMWISPQDEVNIQEQQCLKRRVIGNDIANMALFLASDSSSACTAQEFVVDAGII